MFAAIYEFHVKDGQDAAFIAAWAKLTEGIYRHDGSRGSRLHKSAPGVFVAYAQWPDRATWEAIGSTNRGPEYVAAGEAMRHSLVSSRTVYELELEADYLHDMPFDFPAQNPQ